MDARCADIVRMPPSRTFTPVTEPNGYKVTTGPLENAHLCTCDVVTCRDPRPRWLPDRTVPASPVVAVDEFTLCDYATMIL